MERTVGEIRLFAGNYVPLTGRGDWLACDGAALPSLAAPADAPQNTIRYIICVEGSYPRRP